MFSLLCMVIFTGCGYFENDGIGFQKTILGNIKIQRQENSKVFHLVFAISEETYSVIIEDCVAIFFDSADSVVFVKKSVNEHIDTFYQIKVINPTGKKMINSLEKEEIKGDDFVAQTKLLVPLLPQVTNLSAGY